MQQVLSHKPHHYWKVRLQSYTQTSPLHSRATEGRLADIFSIIMLLWQHFLCKNSFYNTNEKCLQGIVILPQTMQGFHKLEGEKYYSNEAQIKNSHSHIDSKTSTQFTDTSISCSFYTRAGIFLQPFDRKDNIWYYIIIVCVTKTALGKLVCQDIAYIPKY